MEGQLSTKSAHPCRAARPGLAAGSVTTPPLSSKKRKSRTHTAEITDTPDVRQHSIVSKSRKPNTASWRDTCASHPLVSPLEQHTKRAFSVPRAVTPPARPQHGGIPDSTAKNSGLSRSPALSPPSQGSCQGFLAISGHRGMDRAGSGSPVGPASPGATPDCRPWVDKLSTPPPLQTSTSSTAAAAAAVGAAAVTASAAATFATVDWFDPADPTKVPPHAPQHLRSAFRNPLSAQPPSTMGAQVLGNVSSLNISQLCRNVSILNTV